MQYADLEDLTMYIGCVMDSSDYRKHSNFFDAFQMHYPVMQYTGLKDSKGQEIYEGDILAEPSKDKDLYMRIIFRQGCFGYWADPDFWVELGRNHHYFDLTENSKHPEQSTVLDVSGNIYENPELLE
jgi:hypothetical protein